MRPPAGLEILPVLGLPEVGAGDDLAALLAGAAGWHDGDVLVVAQKIVSKAEGRLLDLAGIRPGAVARAYAQHLVERDARFIQAVLDESVRVVRDERVLIVQTRHGFVCANAGIDHSNVPGPDRVVLLPLDPDASARRLREGLRALTGRDVAIIVADTFGRAWRMGIANVALGVAGLAPLVDHRGLPDDFGREMQATLIAVADELAGAAELVMGKTARVPAAIVRGWPAGVAPGRGRDLIRPADLDLFR
ncbi:MAG: coenzyme F420-0:L-glutamate ligase [Candidatus Dormibacteraeota bacterium]|nr:coenzyme F420-0:L-glutamate ligase [Candidatus Dormibacteraeota bacterium]